MIPIEKVQDIIVKHDNLEKELSSGNIDTKLFAKKSKEYSNLGHVILYLSLIHISDPTRQEASS